ncbi:hypothetical protein ABEB36_013378 [Hypothenemus hampei]|uniref:Cytochrome c oxidase assembly protein COX20, mitochondrial n=1 Tax=Hypothenemus hampei TaxID=57062 RepID=A0ABD1E823_HYPHA
MSDEEDNIPNKSVIIFGRDVSQIPCFRNSFLYGILGGAAFGLAHFMFTSKVAKSANYSVYSFSMITIAYWMRCRYNYSAAKFEAMRIKEVFAERAILEGSLEKDRFSNPNVEVEAVEV